MLKGVEAAGFSVCTEVQAKVLPVSLTGRDVMVQSKTGSGKTAIYVLTILEAMAKARAAGKSDPKALIIAPTRELAVQIEEDTAKLSVAVKDLVVGSFFGGVGYGKQDELIEQGCDIFVATPGRILDYQKMHKIDFRQFDIFVVDEADRLFDMGFYPDIQRMFSLLRPCTERQTMLFSATLGTKVRNLAWSFMNEPVEIEVEPEEVTVKLITQELYHISKAEKFGLFLYLLKEQNPANCLIFANTKARCIEVAKRLSLNGYPAKYLMGDMIQSKRLETIDRMKEGKLSFLVATDVAARGLQIDDLEMVVNYDIPDDYESYVHRIGRTARAGKSGKSITLADEEYVFNLEAIETFIQMKIPVIWPDMDEVAKIEDKSAHKSFRDLVSRDEYSFASDRRGGARGTRSGGRRSSGPPAGRARSSGGRQSGPRPKPKSGPRKSSGQVQGGRRRPPEPRRSGGSSKSYAQIQALSLDERLAYYKEQYQKESGAQVGGSRPTETRERRPAQQQRPPQPVAKPAAKPPVEAMKGETKKKGSFFTRLLGKGKKRDA
ncbi:MAG: DEAD/DEAH box helicase [Sphaerochaeta sp.]|nr:DEAD/DEAH box helicase [Sphaerochaeta sp.]MDX9914555.1 DEAD/DEAH box helicase [Sphaerochaeta sp.]